jgi:hypothetical protein
LLCLLSALVLAVPAKAATTTQIIRDCADDGVLEGHYSAADLRKALRHLPTDVAEYSNCTDVLSRAADAAASRPRTPSAQGGANPGGAGTSATPTPAADNARPTTPQDTLALVHAAHAPPPTVQLGGRRVAGLTATVGRNSLPSSLLVVLVLLGAAALAIAAPTARRVLARRRRG